MKILSSFLVTSFLVGAATLASAKPIKPNAEAEAHRAKMIETYDTNKDGKLDDAEKDARRTARVAIRFDRIDTNDDGLITLVEMTAAADRRDDHRDNVKVRDHRNQGKAKGHTKVEQTKAQKAKRAKAAKAKKNARARAKAAIVVKPGTSV